MGESILQRFELEGFETTWCQRLADARSRIDEPWVAVISDVRLADGLATRWFAGLSSPVRAIPWFFLTGYGSVSEAVEAIRAGAREYLTKPFDIERLVDLVQESAGASNAAGEAAVLGISPAMRLVEAMVRRVAGSQVSVLLTGESGVGKEVAAHLMHRLDPRRSRGEFIAVNCAAVPDTMVEAEFFGYEKGAFSGASRAHRGFLERANAGTLFLDEVGELPPAMQAKLLRALQERSFFRLGSERITQSDFRVISASNRDLLAGTAAGTFREDLYYRLAVIHIALPPLRERPDDIRWLTERMLQEIVAEQGRPIAMSESFLRDILGRRWNGNARELRSYLEQAVVLSEAGVLDLASPAPPATSSDRGNAEPMVPLSAAVAEAERIHIRRAIALCDGSVLKTAEMLGISRKTLWEKMRKLDIRASDPS